MITQGVSLEELGVPRRGEGEAESSPPRNLARFAGISYLPRNPDEHLLDHSSRPCSLHRAMVSETADRYFDTIGAALAPPGIPSRGYSSASTSGIARGDRQRLAQLMHHRRTRIRWDGASSRLPAGGVVRYGFRGFGDNAKSSASSPAILYLAAIRRAPKRRDFSRIWATATDHGPPSARRKSPRTKKPPSSTHFERRVPDDEAEKSSAPRC